jgi:hypothetical protein
VFGWVVEEEEEVSSISFLEPARKIETEKFLFGAENALVLHKHVITIIKKKTKSKSLSLSLFSRNFFGSRGERCY